MICETCKVDGKKSMVYPQSHLTTSAYYPPFYDEEGRFHIHDGNVVTTVFRCSNGHEWETKSTSSCWCGWSGEKNAKTVQSE